MICSHCRVNFHTSDRTPAPANIHISAIDTHIVFIGKDADSYWWLEKITCPACKRFVLRLVNSDGFTGGSGGLRYVLPDKTERISLIRPRIASRPPVPAEVPSELAKDYLEACLIIADSPKASAALSRRCLQQILRDKARVQHSNDLATAIGEAVDDPSMPSDMAACLDAVRHIGNFAAHPNKGTHTGEIIEVESGEAEWCLEVIEMLFDYYFVRPANIQGRISALNNKLVETGKPTIPVPGGTRDDGEISRGT